MTAPGVGSAWTSRSSACIVFGLHLTRLGNVPYWEGSPRLTVRKVEGH